MSLELQAKVILIPHHHTNRFPQDGAPRWWIISASGLTELYALLIDTSCLIRDPPPPPPG